MRTLRRPYISPTTRIQQEGSLMSQPLHIKSASAVQALPAISSRTTVRRPKRKSSRQLLIDEYRNLQRLIVDIELELERRGRDPHEWQTWTHTCLAQARISNADVNGETSQSPESQFQILASYMVEHQLRPLDICFESQSAFRRTAVRREWQRFFYLIESGELVVDCVICVNIERFARREALGHKWLEMLRTTKVDLHEADNTDDPPKNIEKCFRTYSRKLSRAAEDSEETSERVRKGQRKTLAKGLPLTGFERSFGFTPRYETVNARNGQTRLKQIGAYLNESETALKREALQRLAYDEPRWNLNALITDWNERGDLNRGQPWDYSNTKLMLLSPRNIAREAFEGERWRLNYVDPAFTDDEYNDLCAALTHVRGKRGPRITYMASGFPTCTCGNHLTGTKRVGNGTYHCSHHKAGVRTCRCGQKHCRCGGIGTSADGVRHVTGIPMEVIDTALMRVALLCYSRLAVARAAGESIEGRLDEKTASRRRALQMRIDELEETERRTRKAWRQCEISQADYDTELPEIGTQLEVARAAYSVLAESDRRRDTAKIDPDVLNKQMAARSNGWRMRRVREVIDACEVVPDTAAGWHPYDRLRFTFKDGCAPVPVRLAQLMSELNAEFDAARVATTAAPRVSATTEERMWELREQGTSTAAIGRALLLEGRRPPGGGARWHKATLVLVLRRQARAHGVEFKAIAGSAFKQQTLDVVFDLHHNNSRSLAETAADLNALEVPSAMGRTGRWTPSGVSHAYGVACRRRGLKGRPLSGRRAHSPLAFAPSCSRYAAKGGHFRCCATTSTRGASPPRTGTPGGHPVCTSSS